LFLKSEFMGRKTARRSVKKWLFYWGFDGCVTKVNSWRRNCAGVAQNEKMKSGKYPYVGQALD